MTAIQTCKLVKKYKNKTAVDNVDLNVNKGELFALLGVNGAGKSTMIKMLSGLIKPSSGDAFLMGKSIVREQKSIKNIMNVSPQQTAVAPNLTVEENLSLIAGIYGMGFKEANKKAEKTIDELSMYEIKNSRAKILSGGWQRRLSIAMALISDPEILFLDEPTLGLDVLARRELWTEINKLRGKTTIILTTHYLEEAQALSDRIGIMVKGKLKATGTAKELIDKTGKSNFEDAFIHIASDT